MMVQFENIAVHSPTKKKKEPDCGIILPSFSRLDKRILLESFYPMLFFFFYLFPHPWNFLTVISFLFFQLKRLKREIVDEKYQASSETHLRYLKNVRNSYHIIFSLL